MRDRIRPPRDLEFVLDRLKDEGVFETKQKGIMFAAAVGFAFHRDEVDAVELEHPGEGIRLEYFERPQDHGFIDLLAVTKANELNILDPNRQEERMGIFEKYAALGLQDMKRYCYDDRPDDSLLGLLDLLDDMMHSSAVDLPGLDTVAEELGEYF